MCEAHRLVYHSTLGLRVINKKKKTGRFDCNRPRVCTTQQESGDTTPCNVTPVILHGVVSPEGTSTSSLPILKRPDCLGASSWWKCAALPWRARI